MYIEELLGICQRISIKAIHRINEINKQRKVVNPMLVGECNRAAIIFYLYLHHDLYQRNFVDCMYNKKWYTDDVILFNDTTRAIKNDPFDVYGISCDFVHGELARIPELPEQFWHVEHTIIEVEHHAQTIYIDITSGQFQDINKKIPDSYIGFEMPWWFYPDRDNPEFNKIKSGA